VRLGSGPDIPDPLPNHVDNVTLNGNGRGFNLSASIQNVRSLNISTKNDITLQKILAICSVKTDLIFLSDIRMNSAKQVSALHDLKKLFFFKGYELFHNSTTASRGVGILVKREIIPENFEILAQTGTRDCNSLLMHVKIFKKEYVICAVYGPNHDTEIDFYAELKTLLRNYTCPILMGGDWNATLDTSHVTQNIDVLNMRNVPSIRRSLEINEICDEFNLADPFRIASPFKKEYTYVPSNINEINRSRIDFFLISHCLFNANTRCSIPHSLSSTLFDHKNVNLYLSGKKVFNREIIKDSVLGNPDLSHHVKRAVIECYLHHCIPGRNRDGTVSSEEQIRNYLLEIGRIAILLEEVKTIEIRIAKNGLNNLDELQIEAKRAEIRLKFDDLPNLEYFENLTLGCAEDIFFQTLVNCIKMNTLSHQSFIFKQRGIRNRVLTSSIVLLKRNFEQNIAQILVRERELSNLVENDLREELAHFKKFENLNNEKITPFFMNLVKTKNMGDSIDNLRRDDGTAFQDKIELKNYVGEFFKNIYKQENNHAKNATVHDIERFLGPVSNNDIVINSKLTEEEKNSLETEITLEELTASINKANLASAPGADGITNRFIKHFWDFFKTPMLRLCKKCHEEQRLPIFLKTANIKLIPKKGDTSKIKNWRPISLLNCFYKIISRVITLRLRKFMDKMTPICQKGYSGTRYCQEVLINVIENVERLNCLKKPGCLVSLDIKKAFDSLSHSYLESVYKFYNFGPIMIKWITTLCTNRKACVIIDGQLNTDMFDLERGNAQGDTISPFLFNLGYQILLFKLELSLQIEGILSEFAALVEPAQDIVFLPHGNAQQVSVHDPKAFALADDCTLLLKLDPDNLRTVIEVLNNFENISGLGCNLEKTALMPLGVIGQLPQEIVDIGFEIKDEITLLGAKIKNNGTCYSNNIGLIIEKIQKQSNYWKRFNLSLPGRISIAKTFLYSQINYLGCFLPITQEDIKRISCIIEEFVSGKLKISKSRIFQSRCEGGLELIDLNEYIAAQTCSWVKRAYSKDDLWKQELLSNSYGTVFNVRCHNFNKTKNPILHNIAEKYEKFLFKFTVTNENFRKAFVYDNPALTFDVNRTHFLKKTFFTDDEWRLYGNEIKTLTMDKLLGENDTVKSKNQFENATGIFLTDIKFNKLRCLARSSLLKYVKNTTEEKKTDTVKNFLMRTKRGSKRIRKILSGKHECIVSPNILKFAELTDTFINSSQSKILNLSWGFGYLHNSMRTFIFKLHGNTLGINSRVSHFVRGHPNTCTFCDLSLEPDENSETIVHLFFECRHVELLLKIFYTWIFNSDVDRFVTKSEFFVGFNLNNDFVNKTLHIINLLVKKFIWDCKLRFTIPTSETLKRTIINELR